VAVGIDAHMTFQAPVALGDTLRARAREVSRSRRFAVYCIELVRDDGRDHAQAGSPCRETAVSTFTGTVYIKG
jgi:acyl-coenzyme A thioesterase PaaI-like protein